MTDKREEAERCAAVVRAALKNKPRLYTLTTYGRGQTDWVRLFIADGGEIRELTYYVARAAGSRAIVPGKGWPMRGGQYSKALEMADWACRIAGINLDQARWSEL